MKMIQMNVDKKRMEVENEELVDTIKLLLSISLIVIGGIIFVYFNHEYLGIFGFVLLMIGLMYDLLRR